MTAEPKYGPITATLEFGKADDSEPWIGRLVIEFAERTITIPMPFESPNRDHLVIVCQEWSKGLARAITKTASSDPVPFSATEIPE